MTVQKYREITGNEFYLFLNFSGTCIRTCNSPITVTVTLTVAVAVAVAMTFTGAITVTVTLTVAVAVAVAVTITGAITVTVTATARTSKTYTDVIMKRLILSWHINFSVLMEITYIFLQKKQNLFVHTML